MRLWTWKCWFNFDAWMNLKKKMWSWIKNWMKKRQGSSQVSNRDSGRSNCYWTHHKVKRRNINALLQRFWRHPIQGEWAAFPLKPPMRMCETPILPQQSAVVQPHGKTKVAVGVLSVNRVAPTSAFHWSEARASQWLYWIRERDLILSILPSSYFQCYHREQAWSSTAKLFLTFLLQFSLWQTCLHYGCLPFNNADFQKLM